jgi:serine/threonine-protein kinase
MGAPATPASDLYSLGIVAYECLAGAPPFTGPPLAVALAHRDRPLPPLPAWVPADVAALVLELTAKDPAARPRSAGEVARRAGQLAGGLPAATAQAAAPWGDPVVTVPGQTARYPAVEPVPDAAATVQATWHLPSPAADGSAYGPGEAPGAWQRHRRNRAGRIALAVVAAALVVVAAVVIASVINSGPPPHVGAVPPATPSATSSAKVTTVDVNPGSLIGRPVVVAAHQLRQQGLWVHVVWRPSDQQQAGSVVAVQPAGQRPVGSVVTLTVASHGHGRGHGDGQQGQQGGD